MVSHPKYGCGNPGMDRSHPEGEEERDNYSTQSTQSFYPTGIRLDPIHILKRRFTEYKVKSDPELLRIFKNGSSQKKFGALAEILRRGLNSTD